MFRNMEYIYEVYRERSFSKAAKNLYVTQPCLSAMVKKTEQKLGLPVFNRNTNPIQLTECGQEYVRYIEQIMALENDFENYLNDIRGLKIGRISIGSNNVFASFVLPQIISNFNELYPGIEVSLFEGNITYMGEHLAKGDLDLVLDNYPMNENTYSRECLCSELLLLAVPLKDHDYKKLESYRLSYEDIAQGRHLMPQTKALPIHYFAENSFIALRHGNDTRRKMDQLCAEAGFVPRIRLEVDQLATAYNIVCNNMGATLVSDTLITRTAYYPNIVYYKLASENMSRFAYFYYKNTSYVTKAMREFMRIAVETFTGSA